MAGLEAMEVESIAKKVRLCMFFYFYKTQNFEFLKVALETSYVFFSFTFIFYIKKPNRWMPFDSYCSKHTKLKSLKSREKFV